MVTSASVVLGETGQVAVAKAEPMGGPVALEVQACDRVAEASVRRLVAIELGDLLDESGRTASTGRERLTIQCSDNLVYVQAASTDGRVVVDRRLRLDDFPADVAPRVLALAGIEVLAALSPAVRQRLANRRTAPPASVEGPLPVTTRAPAPSSTTHLGVAALWRTFLVPGGLSLWGGKAGLDSRIGQWLGLGFDLEGAGARKRIDLGATSAWLVSAGAFAGMNLGTRQAGVAVMAGARFGAVHLSGDAGGTTNVSAASASRPWGGPAVCVRAAGGLGPIEVTVAAEVGRSLLAAEGLANSATVLAARGTWAALSLGAAYRINPAR